MVMFAQLPNIAQPPSALAKYVVVAVGETLMDEPVPADVPPHEAVYHCQSVAEFRLPVAMLNVVACVPQLVFELAVSVGNVGCVQLVVVNEPVTVGLLQLIVPS